jgi:hypothetical protein
MEIANIMAANKKTETQATETPSEPVNVRVRYDSMETQFASQFIVNASREELILNLSPGYIAEPGTNERLLPIQTRIALTPQGAARLVKTLSAVLQNTYATKPAGEAAEEPDDAD